jgi:undecaprenyl-diphosphatase
MTIIQAIILSIIEGISEFLPISSTGHLILANSLLHITESDFVKSFEIFIQLGAILAVVVLYAKSVLVNRKILKRVFAAFLPTAIIGFVLYKFIKHYLLGNPWVVVISLFVGGILLIWLELFHTEKKDALDDIQAMSLKQALMIGIAQSFSVIPGVSRAAATIVGGQFVGLTRRKAVEFSFLLAIPTMAAATGLDLVKSNALTFTTTEFLLLALGFIVAFFTAFFVVKFFLRFMQTHTFIPFGIYRILIAIVYTLVVLR